MNTLIVLGCIGIKHCYLNVSKEEALRRYRESEGKTEAELAEILAARPDWFEILTFDDEFRSYDVYGTEEIC